MKKATIKDVAREAGVSIATVSNALNNVDVLHPKTKEHVLQVAERLNYIPNQNGQNLRARESKAIGLFVSSMTGTFYGVLADSMHHACQKYGYELYIYITESSATLLSNLIGRRVDGAVVLYEGIGADTIKKLDKARCPIVFLDKETTGPTRSSVLFDSLHEGEMAANYLISLGHRNLMHVYGFRGNYDSDHREKGFLRALEAAGLPFPKENLLEGRFERDAAFREMKRFLQEGHTLPDAIFASNDLSAIGCMEALRDAGIRVPEDISIIGCDDIEVCELLTPPLTTIRTCFQHQGEIVIHELMRLVSGRAEGSIKKTEGNIIIRHSCRARERGN